MRSRCLILLLASVTLAGCGSSLDVKSLLRDFDYYDQDLRAVASDEGAIATLDLGQQKRSEAGILVEQGKNEEAFFVAEKALADARLSLEQDRLHSSARRAEKCLREVEQARAAWSEALFNLEQTEEFLGTKAVVTTRELTMTPDVPVYPASTLSLGAFPPESMEQATEQWNSWRAAARDRQVAVADLESIYRRSEAQARREDVDDEALRHHIYISGRAAQTMECRVRTEANERASAQATELTGSYGAARAEALAATLELERGLQDDLRGELVQLRAEARTRQDELYQALSQMEGKFASIRRDARGTIVSLADILFDFDKATLRRDVEFNLVKIATILNQFQEMKVLIEGHTDAIGSEEYNLGLSQRRARAVYDFLVSQDVDPDRLASAGYGESRPIADNETEEGRQRNRRVDLVIQDAQ